MLSNLQVNKVQEQKASDVDVDASHFSHHVGKEMNSIMLKQKPKSLNNDRHTIVQ